MIGRLFAILALAQLASGAFAQEYIVTDGPLSDRNFYRLVSCAAPPDGPCNDTAVRWNQSVVTVSFAPIPSGYPADLAREFSRALDRSIVQINASAPGLNLRRVSKSDAPDVRLFLQPIVSGDAIRGTGFPDMDGHPIGAALVQVYWDQDLNITDATIVFAMNIPIPQAAPIMLEELSQAMGLMTDIRNPFYEMRSVFSEDSNSVAKLGAQDRDALRRHYPARNSSAHTR